MKRKYFRVKVLRIPPFSSINGSYSYEEDTPVNLILEHHIAEDK